MCACFRWGAFVVPECGGCVICNFGLFGVRFFGFGLSDFFSSGLFGLRRVRCFGFGLFGLCGFGLLGLFGFGLSSSGVSGSPGCAVLVPRQGAAWALKYLKYPGTAA